MVLLLRATFKIIVGPYYDEFNLHFSNLIFCNIHPFNKFIFILEILEPMSFKPHFLNPFPSL
jgi:hypothetical protein